MIPFADSRDLHTLMPPLREEHPSYYISGHSSLEFSRQCPSVYTFFWSFSLAVSITKCPAIIHHASANPHVRATFSTTSFASPAVLASSSPVSCVTASHTARAAPRSALLRNCTTVLKRGTRASAHMNALTISRDVDSCCSESAAASASTGMSEASRAGSSEAPTSAGRVVGGMVYQPDDAKEG